MLLAHDVDVPKSDIEKAVDDTASRQQNVDMIVISDRVGNSTHLEFGVIEY